MFKMTPFFACVLYLFVFSRVRCLKLEEAGQFFNSRRYGGFVSVSETENSFVIVSNGLPDHAPDSLTSQSVIPRNNIFSVPKNPSISEKPGCLPMGPIGISRTGVVLFNPLNLEGQNAVEGDTAEQLDQCNGHPDPTGVYHYHALPKNCLYKGREDELIGVARDGFPIYGPMASDLKREVMNSDLDKCHGRFVNGQYRYHATSEFPYFMGCLRGNIPRRMDELTTTCNETSAFDKKWGYLCHCGRPNTMERQGQGRFSPGMGVNGSPRPIGFVPGQGQNQFGIRQMLPGSMMGGQIPGQVIIGPNGQPIRTGNQIQIGPNGQIISNENQLQIGPNGQIIGRGNQVQVGANGQIINPESQLQAGPNGNPIQMPVMTGPAAIQGQGPRPLGFLPNQQLGGGSEQSNINQGQSQIPRPLGFLPTQQPPEGEQVSVGPNGQIVNNRNLIQMPIPTGPAAIQGQGPRPLGFLPVQQQGEGEQVSVGPNGQIINNRNPIQMPIQTGPAAIQGQGPRPLGFLPVQQQGEGEQISVGPNGQLINSGSQIQINRNGNPIQMPLTTGPAAIQGQGQRPLGFLPVQQQNEAGQFSGNPGQGQIPRPIGFLPNANGRPTFPIPQNGEQLNNEQPRLINNVFENGDQPRNVNGVTENGEQPRAVNGIQQTGEQPLPIFVNGVAQNPDQPMTRLVRTQNGQVIPVMVNSGSQIGQTLTVPRIARPMGNNGMFQRRPFGQQSPPFLTPNGGMIQPTNSPVPGQPPMMGPPLVEPNGNGMVIGQGQGRFQPINSQPSSNAAVQGQTETIEGLEIIDKSTQENRQETPNVLFRKPFDGQRRRLSGSGKYGRYRLFNMYLGNSL
ncbi:glutenin, high molecular weight subunit PW212-like isoform X3 [Pecten maximus]|uniref:glutenin, high molecular weight subunit PW212-like isoform X3 n=1 Tax=Pecten maximus TaxID=6579 RepID=UPI001457F8EA|nr:glutenin, high molecular weight subunit PW212-like isoform X3 [Pecten maximus]